MFETRFSKEWQKLFQKQFTTPSEIQNQSYEPLSKGETAVLISPTGTGKTLAYMWPLFAQLREGVKNQCVILAPSQELAMQLVKVAEPWAKAIGLNILATIGGANINRQIDKLKKNPEIVIGTPGRVLELMNRRKIRADYVSQLVLDEADLLISGKAEWNFTWQIIKKVKRDVQIVAVSATAASQLERLMEILPDNVVMIDTCKEDTTQGELREFYLEIPMRKRLEQLRKLAYVPGVHAIVFFNTVGELGAVADRLTYEGIPISTLASDQSKFERKMALDMFEQGKSIFLLTTDVSSRGLDLPNVDLIIHYDVPEMTDAYIHRCGRVARMQKAGYSIALGNDKEIRRLAKMTKHELQPVYVHHNQITAEPK